MTPADRYILAGDETALPAMARILEELPAQSSGIAILEVQDQGEVQQIDNRTGIQLRWLFRNDAAPGTTTLIQDAIKDLREPAPKESFFVWISGEFASAQAIRAYLRTDWRVPKNRYLATSYWRRGQTDHDGPESDDPQ